MCYSSRKRKVLSSNLTFFYKYIFIPGFIGSGTFIIFRGIFQGNYVLWVGVIPFMIGVYSFWTSFAGLKYVAIEGGNLIISNFFKTVKVSVKDIKSISEDSIVKIGSCYVWIEFYYDTIFGNKIVFVTPDISMFWTSPHSVVVELNDAIDQCNKDDTS
jgi:hypothetical protein